MNQPAFCFFEMVSDTVEDYGGEGQRNALKNLVNRAQTHEEAQGLLHAFQKMKGIDYELVNVSLHYRGNQGLDMIFKTRDGSLAMVALGKAGSSSSEPSYAVVEAKHGRGPEILSVDSKGREQGSPEYNFHRLKKYLTCGDGSQKAEAQKLLRLMKLNKIKSFATFYKGSSLYELQPVKNKNKFKAVRLTK